ncbi:amino acid adenylation domain-containing protein [Brevibacterium sp. JNUCC-42]|nr:amino acid adenylation domain-containing protein [Brevibacterium sp. JNUCC-42]
MIDKDLLETGIAIIGMSGRFPGAKNIEEFWTNLAEGVESITFFSEEEILESGIDLELVKKNPNYVRANGYLSNSEYFDASFFGFSQREAEITDPQQRLFLECAWEAMEHAGYVGEKYEGRIGVYAGTGASTYLISNLLSTGHQMTLDEYSLFVGNDKDFLAPRVSYKLSLRGPSVGVQTACSTSLVAVHLACQSLLSGECDMALAGGSAVSFPQKQGHLYQEGMIFSPDGHCRAFDSQAKGTVGGSGVGSVLLKRLEDALADRDTIHAVIRGSAVNNDGGLRLGFTAPSALGQADVIAEAINMANITADTITYVETHGTGTSIGDPVEIEGLTQAFRKSTEKMGYCAIGSVKANIGHLDTAAGVTGLIKTTLALKHKKLPPLLHFTEANPKIDFANSPFYPNTELTEWESKRTPRRAGISSFGIGATNAHVIVEEAPYIPAQSSERPYHLLVLSAQTDTALEVATIQAAHHFEKYADLNISDVAYTLQVGRKEFDHRGIVVCRSMEDAILALTDQASERVYKNDGTVAKRPVAFLFTGESEVLRQMAREMYSIEPIFSIHLDLVAEKLQSTTGINMHSYLLTEGEAEQDTLAAELTKLVVPYAVAHLWLSWGVHPDMAIGEGIGEYVARYFTNELSLDEFLAHALAYVKEGERVRSNLFQDQVRILEEKETYVLIVIGTEQKEKSPFSAMHSLLSSLGRLWLEGIEVNWGSLYEGEERFRIPLPTYPFERKRYFIDRPKTNAHSALSELAQAQAETAITSQAVTAEEIDPAHSPTVLSKQIEQKVASCWKEVLGVQQVSADDSFYEMGGDSLLITQLISRLERVLPVKMDMQVFFEADLFSEFVGLVEKNLIKQLETDENAHTPLIQRSDAVTQGEYPLSFSQQRLWFLHQMNPENTAYNLPYAFSITGRLDVRALKRSIEEIMKRHEILRTTFAFRDGQPVQRVAPAQLYSIPVLSLEEKAEETDRETIMKEVMKGFNQPFHLQTDQLFRCQLLRFTETEHVLLINYHHIITDGWSHSIFNKELTTFYQAFAARESIELPPLSIQYGDFAKWQHQRHQEGSLEAQVDYWKQKLEGVSGQLALPTDYPRTSEPTLHGKQVPFFLSHQVTKQLQELSRKEGATLFMTLMAAFKVLLYRYSGDRDSCVGTTVANRNNREIEELIGFFVNNLVIRSHIEENLSFRQLIQEVRTTCLEAYAHQDLPFNHLISELNLERSLSHNPLFQVMFVLQNTPASDLELPGLTFSPLLFETEALQSDLTLEMVLTEDRLTGNVAFNTGLFTEETIYRMMGHFKMLLEGIITNPDESIETLPLLTELEKEQLLLTWNQTSRIYPIGKGIHHLFEEKVAQYPDHNAIMWGEMSSSITFDELNRQANQLAHHLIALGVGLEVPIGICVERSPWYIIGMLAVLKAGGTYVPIDPAIPTERINYQIEDSGVLVMLTTESLMNNLPIPQGGLVVLDREWEQIEQLCSDNPEVKMDDHVSAYIIYTSGSTGRPKGVRIQHKSVANLIHWFIESHELTNSDRSTFTFGLGFDGVTLEVWPSLIAGACMFLPDEETRLSPEKMQTWLIEKKITFASAPTPMAELLMDLDWPAEIVLRMICMGGDKLRAYPKKALPFLISNNYGPTESTCVVTYSISDTRQVVSEKVNIGRPVPNTLIYILDRHMQPVPVGVAGEIHIGGIGLTSGYVGQPNLADEKFIENPFPSSAAFPSSHLYKTGDLARYLPDGRIEYLERMDQQMKIRGYRIELGEIEAVLTEHTAVREAVVIVHEDEAEEKRLVAYVVPNKREEKATMMLELRSYLQAKLPRYMVPAHFLEIERIPLTANGKFDRKALPSVSVVVKMLDDVIPPRNEVERILSTIWANILQCESVGVNQNYFEIGGDSIKTIMIISQMKRQGYLCTPDQFFKNQTIAELAEGVQLVVQNEEGAQDDTEKDYDYPLVKLNRSDFDHLVGTDEEIVDAYPLTALQKFMLARHLEKIEPGKFFVNMVFVMNDDMDENKMKEAWQEVGKLYPATRTCILYEGLPHPVQAVRKGVQIPVEFVDWRHMTKEQQEEALRKTQQKIILANDVTYLSRPSTYKILFFRISERRYQIIMSASYLLMDGWTHFIVLIDLLQRYYALREGKQLETGSRRSYHDYIDWLQRLDHTEAENYWQEELKGYTAPIALIESVPDNTVDHTRVGFGKQDLFIEKSCQQKLQALAAKHHLTTNILMQGAWALLQSYYTGYTTIVYGMMSSGRQSAFEGAETVAGPCINTLPLRIEIKKDMGLIPWLGTIRDKQEKLTQFDYISLETIRKLIDFPADQPLFSNYMIFQNLGSYFSINVPELFNRPDFDFENQYEKALAIYDESTPLRLDTGVGVDHLFIHATYFKQFFRDEAITQMMRDYQSMIELFIEHPDATVEELLHKHNNSGHTPVK